MSAVLVVSAAAIERWRRQAKQLKKSKGVAHHEALDAVARETGLFPDWHHAIEAAKASEPAEEAFKAGFVVGIDFKMAGWFPREKLGHFVDDARLEHFVRQDFARLGHADEEDGTLIEATVYYRWKARVAQEPNDAMSAVRRVFGTPSLRYLRLGGRILFDVIFGEDYGGPWRLEP